MVKQFLQFLLGDAGGLGSNQQAQMRLRLDSTSAQSSFNRLGPGRAKHLSTRLLWSPHAMRRKWFLVERASTRENPADLNTKPLSQDRREYLMRKIGLMSETFNEEGMHGYKSNNIKLKHVVRAISVDDWTIARVLFQHHCQVLYVVKPFDLDGNYMVGIVYVGFGNFGALPHGQESKHECADEVVQGGVESNQRHNEPH